MIPNQGTFPSPSEGYVGMSDEEEIRRWSLGTEGVGETLVDYTKDLEDLGLRAE